MDLRDQLQRRRKDTRLIAVGLFLLLLLLTGILYFAQQSRELPTYLVNNQVLLFVLWYVDIILILTILFVLLRNLFKIAMERHHRILGSKFKTKLVLSFVGLSLIPVLLLFTIATNLLQGSVDRWVATPVGESLERGSGVAEAMLDYIGRDAADAAQGVLAAVADLDLREPADRPALSRLLQDELVATDLTVLAVYDGTEFVQAVVDPRAGLADLPEIPRVFLREAMEQGTASRRPARGALPPLLLAAIAQPATQPAQPAGGGEEPEPPPPQPVVVAGRSLDPLLADQIQGLIESHQRHRQLEVQQENLKASHLLTFLMVTLLILLASSWVGLYLARRVTVPIQALAEGTRRISLGDLDHRVDVPAGDELGVLVESFNRMTRELKRAQQEVERGNLELVAANERTAEERALIAAVLENVDAGVLSTDPEGRILTCNGAALAMLRHRAGEVTGRPIDEVWGDAERAKLARLVTADPEGGRLTRQVNLLLGGEWKTFEVKVTTMAGGTGAREGGAPRGRVMVLEDLTELIKAQQLAAWNEAARRIAHEIKNPLTPIRLSAERMLHKFRQGRALEDDGGFGAVLEDAVSTIDREVAAMQSMVDEFSRYARMPPPRLEPVDLGNLVQDTVQLYREIKEGVAVDSEVAEDLPRAWLDAEKVRRVLINLIDNALAATEAPGEVKVSARRDNGHLEIRVTDTGRGIPVAARDKLFLPHFSTKGRGTGLGLAIVHRIVTEHHGSIRVEDNRPQGSIFTIELPDGTDASEGPASNR